MILTKSRLGLALFLLFTIAQADAADLYPIVEVQDSGWVNVRRGPDPKSPVMGRVRKGDSFAVQSADSRHLILDGPFAGGYIAAEFTQATGQKFQLVKSIASEVLVRAYPSMNGRLVASVNKNAYFAAENHGDWWAIKAGPYKGRFVSTTFVKPIEESGSAATEATPLVSLAAPGAPPPMEEIKPEPEPEASLTTATTLEVAAPAASEPEAPKPVVVTSTLEEPPPVDTKHTAEAAAVLAQELGKVPPPAPPVMKIKGSNVRIRTAPSTNGKVAGVLKGDETFEAEKQGDWYQIKSGPHAGSFVKADFVAPGEPVAQATAASGAVAGAATAGAEAPSLPTEVALASGATISPEASAATSATPTTQAAPAAPRMKLSGSNIRIRKAPSTNGKIAGVLNGDETFEAEKQGDWYQIKSGPHAGSFVKADFVTVQAPAEASAATTSPATATPSTEASSAAAAAAAATVAPTAAPPEPPPAPPKPWDQNTDDRFNAEVAKAFKKKKNFAESNQIPMPVYYEQFKNPSGTVNTRVIGADEIEADATELFKILRKHVAEKWFEKDEIEKIAPKENAGLQWVPISAFKNSGINVFYDPLKLEIRLLVPPEMRGVETVSLNRENDPWSDETFEKPGLITSFLNINATETFDSRNTTFDDRRTPLQAQLENGTNIANFVVEAYGNYTEDRGDLAGKSSFIRQDVRVTRDIPSFTARASVGDVIYPVQSFQVYRPMKGVAFYRQFSMAPSKLTYPTGDNEIFLKNKSKVYIWVNDQLQKMVELPAGRHQLKDFQYTSGMNNVRFEIIDEFGQTEIQDHSYSASSELLKKGLHQFSYAAGSPSGVDPITGERTYNDANDTFSAFHRYGFNNYFTGGLNGQMDSQQSIFGIEGSFSLKKGFLKLESAYGNTEGIGNGYAVSAYYNYQDYEGPEKTQRSLTVGAKHRSDMFSEFGTTTAPTIAKPLDLSAGYSRGISKTMAINFGLNYILNKKITVEASNGFALRLGLSNRWSNGISGNISAAHTKTNSGKDDISVMGFFIWSFPKERQTLSAYGNSADGSSRIGWNYSPSSGADSASYQANYRQNQSETGYGATALINGNRARMGASHEVVLPKDDEPATPAVESERADNVTTLQVGTSLVFARGRFGIGRPVTDSFAIVAPVKSLKGQTLFVNPDREGNYLAKTDWLGPAVVPELASYNPTTLIVGGKDLPLGISIPQSHFNLYPKFKSGYGFALGVDANVYLVAKLVDARGQALAMESGLATNLDDESAPPITIFTTRRGVMQSEGFRSGRYRIDIAPDKYESIEVVVPENAKEEYDLGTLVMKDKK